MVQEEKIVPPGKRFFSFSPRERLLAVGIALLVLVIDLFSYHALVPLLIGQAESQLHIQLQRRVNTFERNLDKYRYLPLTLAMDSDLQRFITAPEESSYPAIHQKLCNISKAIGAEQVFLASPTGVILASGQPSGPDVLRSHDISFRPYFRQAVAGQVMAFYAVGTSENLPGYYLSTGIGHGVLALKINLEHLFVPDSPLSEPLALADASGIILSSNINGWNYHTFSAAEAGDLREVANTRQFGGINITPLPNVQVNNASPRHRMIHIDGKQYLAARAAIPGTTMHLVTMRSTAPIYRDLWLRIALLDSVLSSVIFFGYFVSQRLKLVRKIAENHKAIKDAYARLEILVAERSHELQQKNIALENEITERLGFEERERNLQKELIRTEKLAVIGQLSAGLAHEINQPLAAIRAYSENTIIFLQRGNLDATRDNLLRISTLVDRIGALTGQLRSFARPSDESIGQVKLSHCIDNVLVLLKHRLEKKQITLHKDFQSDDIYAECNGLRLEQVLVNLLANAIDVLENRPSPTISVRLFRFFNEAIIEVTDNGPGLSADIIDHVFEPFFTTKTTTGLGLGLAISADIIKSFHGSLSADNLSTGGARFTLRLQLSPAQQENLIG